MGPDKASLSQNNAFFLSADSTWSTVQGFGPFLLQLSIDAFCSHNFADSVGFYMTHVVVTAIQEVPGPHKIEHYWQSMLEFPTSGKMTPWGTPYVPYPAGTTAGDLAQRMSDFANTQIFVSEGEGNLLSQLLHNKHVVCDCLTYEDPYHENFGKKNLVDPRVARTDNKSKSGRKRAYIMNCNWCRSKPEAGAKQYSLCQRCRRVRYCSKECQKADWKQHKPECGRKTAPWWGTAKPDPRAAN